MKSNHSSNPANRINSCDISAINNNSIFKRIITSSLIIYPKDAHQYILNYLISSGLNEKSIIIFQQVWSKTLIGLQSFGKLNNNNNNDNSNVDPELFSNEFIHELSLSDQKILELLNTSITCFKLDQFRRRNTTAVVDMATSSSLLLSSESAGYDVINPLDDIRALEAMSRLGQELATALTGVYDDVLLKELDRHHRRSGRHKMKNGHDDGDTADDSIHDYDDDDAVYHSSSSEEMFESISLFRRSLRGTRIIWQHNVMINESNASYSPLDRLIHGYPGMIRGILDMQLRANRDDLNIYLTGNELIGVMISNKQPLHQEKGWNAYQCLNELISNNNSGSSSSKSSIQGFNIFPLPVGIYRDPIKLSITFAYELINKHEIIRFHEILMNPMLSIYLRQNPIIIQSWCQQLYKIYHKLLLCTTGSLMKPINILSDVNIRDSGLLLISNISFDTILPKNKTYYKIEILSMICYLLSSALCVSRIVKTSLQYVSSDDRNDDRKDISNDDNHSLSKFKTQREIIVPIVVGSTLQLSFTGHGCSVISINGIELNPSSSAAATTTVKSTMYNTSSSSSTSKNTNNDKNKNNHDKKRNRYRPDVINHPIARNTGEISLQALSTLSIDIMSSSSSSSSSHDDDDDTVDVSYEQYVYIRAHSHQSSTSTMTNDDSVQNNNNSSGGSRGNYDDYDTNECIISLTALKAGILTLNVNAIISEFYHHNDHGISHNSVEYDIFRRKSCQLKVILVPEYLTESLQLLDLIGHLEECHNLQDPMILLHSQLFFNRSSSSSSLKNTMITTNTSIHVHDHGNDDDHHHRQNRSKDANDRHNSDYFINTSELQKVWQTIKRELTSTSNSYSGNK